MSGGCRMMIACDVRSLSYSVPCVAQTLGTCRYQRPGSLSFLHALQYANTIPPTSFKDRLHGFTSNGSAAATGALVASALDLQPLSVMSCIVVAQLTSALVSALALAVMSEFLHSQLEVTRKVDFLSSPSMHSVGGFGGVKDLTRYGVESNPGTQFTCMSTSAWLLAHARLPFHSRVLYLSSSLLQVLRKGPAREGSTKLLERRRPCLPSLMRFPRYIEHLTRSTAANLTSPCIRKKQSSERPSM
jgi:hypothetical protein